MWSVCLSFFLSFFPLIRGKVAQSYFASKEMLLERPWEPSEDQIDHDKPGAKRTQQLMVAAISVNGLSQRSSSIGQRRWYADQLSLYHHSWASSFTMGSLDLEQIRLMGATHGLRFCNTMASGFPLTPKRTLLRPWNMSKMFKIVDIIAVTNE